MADKHRFVKDDIIARDCLEKNKADEIKTLKDLPAFEKASRFYIAEDTIRQEAIKWVKFYKEEYKRLLKSAQKADAHYVLGKKRAMIDFFNLPEEELA